MAPTVPAHRLKVLKIVRIGRSVSRHLVLGLVHQYRTQRGSGGGPRPMTKGDFSRFGERAYVRAVIDQRGMGFCEACRRVIAAHA